MKRHAVILILLILSYSAWSQDYFLKPAECNECSTIIGCLACIDSFFLDNIPKEKPKCYDSVNQEFYEIGTVISSNTLTMTCIEEEKWKIECKLETENNWKTLGQKWKTKSGDEYLCKENGPVLIKKAVEEEDPPENDDKPKENLSEEEQIAVQVFELINDERAARGVPPLIGESTLDSYASKHSKRMKSTGKFIHSVIYPQKFSYWAENISYVPRASNSAYIAVSGWMNSSGHRKNILSGYTYSGIGVACNSIYCYITQQFGS